MLQQVAEKASNLKSQGKRQKSKTENFGQNPHSFSRFVFGLVPSGCDFQQPARAVRIDVNYFVV
jgi:hypothetical protein